MIILAHLYFGSRNLLTNVLAEASPLPLFYGFEWEIENFCTKVVGLGCHDIGICYTYVIIMSWNFVTCHNKFVNLQLSSVVEVVLYLGSLSQIL